MLKFFETRMKVGMTTYQHSQVIQGVLRRTIRAYLIPGRNYVIKSTNGTLEGYWVIIQRTSNDLNKFIVYWCRKYTNKQQWHYFYPTVTYKPDQSIKSGDKETQEWRPLGAAVACPTSMFETTRRIRKSFTRPEMENTSKNVFPDSVRLNIELKNGKIFLSIDDDDAFELKI